MISCEKKVSRLLDSLFISNRRPSELEISGRQERLISFQSS